MENINDPLNFHKCKKCTYRTRFLRRILIHVRWHRGRSKEHQFICYLHPPEIYGCRECQFQSHHKVLFTNHFNTIHKTEETKHEPNCVLRCCEKCGFQTYSSLILLSHHNRCDGIENRIFQSSQTEKEIQKHPKLQMRQRTKLKKILRFQCSHCTYKVRYKSNLKNHMLWRHTPSDQIDWLKCERCSYRTKRRFNLNLHIRNRHTPASEVDKLKRFGCNRCSYKSKTRQHLRGHVLWRHTPIEEINWIKCEHCSFEAREKKSMRQHSLAMHAKPATPYNTFEGAVLKSRVLSKHAASDRVNWLQCERCSYKTKWKNHLNRHTRTRHAQPSEIEKLKQFECRHCSYKATTSTHMKTHVLRKHTSDEDIDWFRCVHCSYKAKEKHALRLHLLTQHSKPAELEKLKRFKCDKCSYKALRKSHLRSHLVHMHKDSEVNSYKAKPKNELRYSQMASEVFKFS